LAAMTEIYLCNVCSCQEILRRHGRGQTPTSTLDTILDILRYTAIFPTKRYTAGVRATIRSLADYGFTSLRVKNYWGPGDGYQGINSVFVSTKGLAFELQVSCGGFVGGFGAVIVAPCLQASTTDRQSRVAFGPHIKRTRC
jgi:hypothetical protein